MPRINNVTAYICKNYPHPSELSKTRLTKLVYLSDWKSAQQKNQTLTPITWHFHNFGPYVDDVMESVQEDERFVINYTETMYGDPKMLIEFIGLEDSITGLSSEDTRIIDEVIEETKTMYWDSFIKHVYSTYPIKTIDRYTDLDLIALAVNEQNLDDNKA